jgi:hypothetical protein
MNFRFLFLAFLFLTSAAKAQTDSVATNDSLRKDPGLIITTGSAEANFPAQHPSLTPNTYYTTTTPAITITTSNMPVSIAYTDSYFPYIIMNCIPAENYNFPFIQFLPGRIKDTLPLPGKSDDISCVHHAALNNYIPEKIIPAEIKTPETNNRKIIAGIVSALFAGMIFLLQRIRKK